MLGDEDDFFAEELSIIRSYDLREEFPARVVKEAEKQAQAAAKAAEAAAKASEEVVEEKVEESVVETPTEEVVVEKPKRGRKPKTNE